MGIRLFSSCKEELPWLSLNLLKVLVVMLGMQTKARWQSAQTITLLLFSLSKETNWLKNTLSKSTTNLLLELTGLQNQTDSSLVVKTETLTYGDLKMVFGNQHWSFCELTALPLMGNGVQMRINSLLLVELRLSLSVISKKTTIGGSVNTSKSTSLPFLRLIGIQTIFSWLLAPVTVLQESYLDSSEVLIRNLERLTTEADCLLVKFLLNILLKDGFTPLNGTHLVTNLLGLVTTPLLLS